MSICIDSLLAHCVQGYGQILQLQHLSQHVHSGCKDIIVPPLSKVSVEQLLQLQSGDTQSDLRAHATGEIDAIQWTFDLSILSWKGLHSRVNHPD